MRVYVSVRWSTTTNNIRILDYVTERILLQQISKCMCMIYSPPHHHHLLEFECCCWPFINFAYMHCTQQWNSSSTSSRSRATAVYTHAQHINTVVAFDKQRMSENSTYYKQTTYRAEKCIVWCACAYCIYEYFECEGERCVYIGSKPEEFWHLSLHKYHTGSRDYTSQTHLNGKVEANRTHTHLRTHIRQRSHLVDPHEQKMKRYKHKEPAECGLASDMVNNL